MWILCFRRRPRKDLHLNSRENAAENQCHVESKTASNKNTAKVQALLAPSCCCSGCGLWASCPSLPRTSDRLPCQRSDTLRRVWRWCPCAAARPGRRWCGCWSSRCSAKWCPRASIPLVPATDKNLHSCDLADGCRGFDGAAWEREFILEKHILGSFWEHARLQTSLFWKWD